MLGTRHISQYTYENSIYALRNMPLQVILSLVMLFGAVGGEQGQRFVADENVELDVDQQIFLLKQQMAQQTAQMATLTSETNQLRQRVAELENTKGVTYTRWGRSICDGNGTSTVYSGYMAGSFVDSSPANDNHGAGANYLCLPTQPIWSHYTSKLDNHITVTGVEYNFYPHGYSDIEDFFGSNIAGAAAPCSVCHVERGASIMIPGRTQCYPGWTQEYDGYLVTGYPLFDDATEFICLDKRPESVANTGTFHGKNNLFLVEGICGYDLECPPYVSGRELSCVVCSK